MRPLESASNGASASARRPAWRLVLSALRVRQWVKNLLLFAPLLLAHRFLETEVVLEAALGFVAFSLGASAVYVLNDLLDVEADRRHPQKRRRPFASGELPLRVGLVMIPILLAASLGVALQLPVSFLWILGFYFAATTLYSYVLKEIALLDVLTLAALYTTRIMAGSAASSVPVSEWLLAFSMFFFFSLAAVKRYAEILPLRDRGADESKLERRDYFAGEHELISQMGLCSGFMAVLVLALYITSEAVARLYRDPAVLWLACPLLLYWIGRIWLLARRGAVSDDPLSFAVTDPATWVVAAAGAVVMVAATRGA